MLGVKKNAIRASKGNDNLNIVAIRKLHKGTKTLNW